MTEPRRSTRARAREEVAPPAPETPAEKAAKGAKSTLKRKRTSIAVKDSTPSTPVGGATQQGPQQTLPLRIAEGQPLPTLPEPQPLDLSSAEWQNIQQSGVLSASLQRSRAVWVSGVNFRTFHKKHTMPKKLTERTDADKAGRARQKEIEKNFPQVGTLDAQLVIEPHTFPIKLYAPKEGSRAAPKKMPAPPQQYGAWPNHSQHSQHSQHPPQYQQYNQPPYPPKQQPQPRPPPPKPVQQAPPQTAPGPASTPAPDPVIHMLAARAGTDPELKAVMKIVAAGQASKEQLEFFQTHINELTEILEKNKKAKAPMPLPPTPAPPKHQAPSPAPPKHQASASAPPKHQAPAPAPAPTPQPPYYQQPPPHYAPQQPPRVTYRPLTFEFVEGNGDRFYFPSYSFMEWLPNGSGAKFSFLVTKLKPKSEAAVKPPSTPAPPQTPTPAGVPTITPSANGSHNPPFPPTPAGPTATPTPTPSYIAPPRIEDFDERNDLKDIDFYQPVTVLVLTDEHEVKNALPRAIRPPSVVEKYMEEVFDTCKRAEETYLAFRLPKDGNMEVDVGARSGDVTPSVGTPIADVVMGGMGAAVAEKRKSTAGRSRKSIAV
ncbi:hypothetical protein BU25DRAFT_436331 [Macroventuria anomochaeta]|uniref:Uncharacterized protein n=1 Tax=Macroventuria anomochaeta TaxID=301207 RepID=A0ACB6SE89_9PLEO|nr:uncharacterized protein BU25DRAFT_436331 [Macroventuria anomochaeta]KAF2632536.1 hypothetical protein BU25DRAFT_436331 [Macroventuria anomochaeta]